MSVLRFVAGSTLNSALKCSNRMLNRGSLSVINYAVENKGQKFETFKQYESLANKVDAVAVNHKLALKLSSIEFDRDLAHDLVKMLSEKNIKTLVDSENNQQLDICNKISNELIYEHNKTKVNVVKTYQMYRKDALQTLSNDLTFFKANNILLGIKLVRGAYWHSEHKQGHLFQTKSETDSNYNTAILCLYNEYINNNGINMYNMLATHNTESINLGVLLNQFDKDKPNIFEFCNLLGMQQQKYQNIIQRGQIANVYIPYGPYQDMIPYLMRRLWENVDQLKYCHK